MGLVDDVDQLMNKVHKLEHENMRLLQYLYGIAWLLTANVAVLLFIMLARSCL